MPAKGWHKIDRAAQTGGIDGPDGPCRGPLTWRRAARSAAPFWPR